MITVVFRLYFSHCLTWHVWNKVVVHISTCWRYGLCTDHMFSSISHPLKLNTLLIPCSCFKACDIPKWRLWQTFSNSFAYEPLHHEHEVQQIRKSNFWTVFLIITEAKVIHSADVIVFTKFNKTNSSTLLKNTFTFIENIPVYLHILMLSGTVSYIIGSR